MSIKTKKTTDRKKPVYPTTAVSIKNSLLVETYGHRSSIFWLEFAAVSVSAFLATVWAFYHVGTSIQWDDLFYMNVSQHTTPQAWIMNRYGHIYLQKIFFFLAGDAIAGTKAFWCFQFFGTAVLVYWCARFLAGKAGYLIGMIAVIFLCSDPIFAKFPGCTFSDFTVMLLVTLMTFVYLNFLPRADKYRHLVVGLLGLIFFWSVKSKESAVCIIVLLFGLGRLYGGAFEFRRFAKDIGWLLAGMFAGSLILMTLDWIFIGDPIFSVRISIIQKLFGYNIA